MLRSPNKTLKALALLAGTKTRRLPALRLVIVAYVFLPVMRAVRSQGESWLVVQSSKEL